VNGRETRPNFEHLWHDCLQEEGRMTSRTGTDNDDSCFGCKDKERKEFSPSEALP
jgi:hypothetical protein